MKRFQMKYKVNKIINYNAILNIIGKTFVKNNRNKGKLIIANKKYYLNEHIKLINFKNSELKIDILLNNDICYLNSMFKDCHSLFKFANKDILEKQKIDYDIPKIEKNDNELNDNINKIGEDKGTLYDCLKEKIIYFEYSEISNKEASSELESIYLEILNSKINDKLKEMIYETESFTSLYDKLNFGNIIDISYMFYN